MLSTRVIACLDVHDGRIVKGINFVDLKDAGDPVEQAKIYSDGGADEICFLDITASNENRDIIYDVVEKTSKKCFVPLTVGGGVRSIEDIKSKMHRERFCRYPDTNVRDIIIDYELEKAKKLDKAIHDVEDELERKKQTDR